MEMMNSNDDDAAAAAAAAAGLDYWLRWQVPVCALIIILPSVVAVRLIKDHHHHHNNKSTAATTNGLLQVFWIPCWASLNPIWLLLFRVFALCSMSFILYQTVLHLGGLFSFYFYTQWTFALVILYFALATVVSARGCWKLSSLSHDHKGRRNQLLENINCKAGFLEHTMEAIYQTSAGAVMLTDIVFWCLLLPFTLGTDFKLTLLIVSTHSLNAVFLILDSTLNSLPFSWHGIAYFVLWSVSYVIFQWTLHACGFTWWPYPFLDLSTPSAPLWYIALALVHVPCYGTYVLLLKAKGSIFSWMFPRTFIRSGATMEGNALDKKAS